MVVFSNDSTFKGICIIYYELFKAIQHPRGKENAALIKAIRNVKPIVLKKSPGPFRLKEFLEIK